MAADAELLLATTTGGTGDVDVYMRRGALPTDSSFDAVSADFGNNEQATIQNAAAGDWYIGLRAASSYADVQLTVGSGQVVPLSSGASVTELSGSPTTWLYYKISVPAGTRSLMVTLAGGTGDADSVRAARRVADSC